MLQSAIFIIVMVWLLLAALLFFFQSSLIFYPSRNIAQTPDAIQLEYDDVLITTADGMQIHGWWIPNANARATLLFLHGNAGNVSHRLDSIRIFQQLGLSVFIIDYRGYGQSQGKISEQGTYLDAKAAWSYLVNDKNINPNDIIVFGRSLGGAVAAELTSKISPAGLILESTFTSIADAGKHHYPYLPVKYMARIKYDSRNHLQDITAPTLFIHSPDDEIVPFKLGKALYDLAKDPKWFLQIKGDHNYGFLDSGHLYRQGLDKFITQILKNEPAENN